MDYLDYNFQPSIGFSLVSLAMVSHSRTKHSSFMHVVLLLVLGQISNDNLRLQEDNHVDETIITFENSHKNTHNSGRHYHRHHHHHHNYHYPEYSISMKSGSMINENDVNPLLTVSGFVNSDEERTCSTNIQMSDTNNDMKINSSEFTKFIEYQSNGTVKEDSFADLQSMFVLVFLSTACLTCYEETKDDGCCLGSKANIPIGKYTELTTDDKYLKTLFVVCVPVIEQIEKIVHSQQPTIYITSIPTLSPSTSSTSVTQSSSTIAPSISPVLNPTTSSPFDVPAVPNNFDPTGFTREPSSVLIINQPTHGPSYSPSNRLLTFRPSQRPSSLQPMIPSTAPTARPSLVPSSSKYETGFPSSLPTIYPSPIPSNQPTARPSLVPSSSKVETSFPSSTPTNYPSHIPSHQLTLEPSHYPSGTPLSPPSQMPSLVPSTITTLKPSDPVVKIDCISFSYMIKGLNYTAYEIMQGLDNNIRQGLEEATRELVVSIFNTTYPRNGNRTIPQRRNSGALSAGRIDYRRRSMDDDQQSGMYLFTTASKMFDLLHDESEMTLAFQKALELYNVKNQSTSLHTKPTIHHRLEERQSDTFSTIPLPLPRRTGPKRSDEQESFQQRKVFQRTKSHWTKRRLVYYSDIYPVNITRIIDFPITSNATDTIATNGYIVSSDLCYLIEQGDNATNIQQKLTSDLKQAFLNGDFTNRFPQRSNTVPIP
jgi:hypothetical protein